MAAGTVLQQAPAHDSSTLTSRQNYRLPKRTHDARNEDIMVACELCQARQLALFNRTIAPGELGEILLGYCQSKWKDIQQKPLGGEENGCRKSGRHWKNSELGVSNCQLTANCVVLKPASSTPRNSLADECEDGEHKDQIRAILSSNWCNQGNLEEQYTEIAKHILALMENSNTIDYKTIVQQATLFLKPISITEKRDRLPYFPTLCRGCQCSGPYPWQYRYISNTDVRRVGGGYCYTNSRTNNIVQSSSYTKHHECHSSAQLCVREKPIQSTNDFVNSQTKTHRGDKKSLHHSDVPTLSNSDPMKHKITATSSKDTSVYTSLDSGICLTAEENTLEKHANNFQVQNKQSQRQEHELVECKDSEGSMASAYISLLGSYDAAKQLHQRITTKESKYDIKERSHKHRNLSKMVDPNSTTHDTRRVLVQSQSPPRRPRRKRQFSTNNRKTIHLPSITKDTVQQNQGLQEEGITGVDSCASHSEQEPETLTMATVSNLETVSDETNTTTSQGKEEPTSYICVLPDIVNKKKNNQVLDEMAPASGGEELQDKDQTAAGSDITTENQYPVEVRHISTRHEEVKPIAHHRKREIVKKRRKQPKGSMMELSDQNATSSASLDSGSSILEQHPEDHLCTEEQLRVHHRQQKSLQTADLVNTKDVIESKLVLGSSIANPQLHYATTIPMDDDILEKQRINYLQASRSKHNLMDFDENQEHALNEDEAIRSRHQENELARQRRNKKWMAFRNRSKKVGERLADKETTQDQVDSTLDDAEDDDLQFKFSILNFQRLQLYERSFSQKMEESLENHYLKKGRGMMTSELLPTTDRSGRRNILITIKKKIKDGLQLHHSETVAIAEGKRRQLEEEFAVCQYRLSNENKLQQTSVPSKEQSQRRLSYVVLELEEINQMLRNAYKTEKDLQDTIHALGEDIQSLSQENENRRTQERSCDEDIPRNDGLETSYNSTIQGRINQHKDEQIHINDVISLLEKKLPREDINAEDILRVLGTRNSDWIDYKTFCVISSLAESTLSLDASVECVQKSICGFPFMQKLHICQKLYSLLLEADRYGSTWVKEAPIVNAAIELDIGEIGKQHKDKVLAQLNHHGNGNVDFVDFLLYLPLFLLIHTGIVSGPLTQSKDRKTPLCSSRKCIVRRQGEGGTPPGM